MTLQEDINEQAKYISVTSAVLDALKDPEKRSDPEFRKALGQAMQDRNPAFTNPNYFLGEPDDIVSHGARNLYGDAREDLANIVEGNFDDSLNLVGGENLARLLLQIKPYNETGDTSHDEKASKHKEYLTLTEALRNGDLRPYIDGFTRRIQEFIASEASRKREKITQMAQIYTISVAEEFIGMFKEGDNLNEPSARNYITTNYNNLTEDDEKEQARFDIGLAAAT